MNLTQIERILADEDGSDRVESPCQWKIEMDGFFRSISSDWPIFCSVGNEIMSQLSFPQNLPEYNSRRNSGEFSIRVARPSNNPLRRHPGLFVPPQTGASSTALAARSYVLTPPHHPRGHPHYPHRGARRLPAPPHTRLFNPRTRRHAQESSPLTTPDQ